MAMKLKDRIAATPPCRMCKPSGGIWACDAEGNSIPGKRCGEPYCNKGLLLQIADLARLKRQGVVVGVACAPAIQRSRCP